MSPTSLSSLIHPMVRAQGQGSSQRTRPSFSTGNPRLDKALSDWFMLDTVEETRTETLQLVHEDQRAVLEERFLHHLAFGTAGLRASMGAGFNRMNHVTVLHASQGLCNYLIEHWGLRNIMEMGVVIGHDHRHHSEYYAQIAAHVFLERKIKVYFFRSLVPTPFVPFAVTKLRASAGIMVTASHNPKQDNGYKVYWRNGAQIIPPHDEKIAACIEHARKDMIHAQLSVNLGSDELIVHDSYCIEPFDRIWESYFDQVESLSTYPQENRNCPLRFVYTPVHGVGYPFAMEAFKRFHLPPFFVVHEQRIPDPEFSTVQFPNPEEGPNTLQLALKLADQLDAHHVLANDPDADRFIAAEKQPDGRWHVFNGNQLGVLLAHYIWTHYKQTHPSKEYASTCMLNSIVSSKMLRAMAEQEGFHHEETLTGFKWIGNRALEWERGEEKVGTVEPQSNTKVTAKFLETSFKTLFAYEEAIGFMCSSHIHDKDGITALVVYSEMAAYLYRTHPSPQNTVYTALQDLYRLYGYFVSHNSYIVCEDRQIIQKIFDRLRFGERPDSVSSDQNAVQHDCQIFHRPETPDSISLHGCSYVCCFPQWFTEKYMVTTVRDLTIGYDSTRSPTFESPLPIQAPAQMIMFELEQCASEESSHPLLTKASPSTPYRAFVTLRTSGTEPKIKYYIEIQGQYDEQTYTHSLLDELTQIVVNECIQPERHGLKRRG